MKITLLGCGASAGVPVIGCRCAVCQSGDPKNHRTRVSLLVEYENGVNVLVDTSPDLRAQALRHRLSRIDAVIYTHAHADHTHGIDDLRPFNVAANAEIDAYATAETLEELHQRFPYVWGRHSGGYWQRAALAAHSIVPGDAIRLKSGVEITTFHQLHGKGETLGLRFGDVVYSTDLHSIPESTYPLLQNMKLWIVDCLRDGEAGSHANLSQALEWIAQFKPERAVLTHMNHELDYHTLKVRLPEHVEPGYDGLAFTY